MGSLNSRIADLERTFEPPPEQSAAEAAFDKYVAGDSTIQIIDRQFQARLEECKQLGLHAEWVNKQIAGEASHRGHPDYLEPDHWLMLCDDELRELANLFCLRQMELRGEKISECQRARLEAVK